MERVVDALGVRICLDGGVPVGLDGQALQSGDEEDGNGLQRIERVEEVDGVPHTGFLTA